MTTTDKDIKFGYFNVSTPDGRGVVCIALKRPPKGSGSDRYEAGISYCSPFDSKSFTKKIARDISLGRLYRGKDTHRFIMNIPRVEGQKLSDVFQIVLDHVINTPRPNFKSRNSSSASVAPKWLVEANAAGNVSFGLTTTSSVMQQSN